MSIFYILLIIYIITLMIFKYIFMSFYGLIMFNILLDILKIIIPGRPILCRIGPLFFNKKKINN
jgi:hypothetical protein